MTEKKLELASINNGYYSCSTAALVTGIWWKLLNPDLPPIFLIDKDVKDKIKYEDRHNYVALPLIALINQEIESEIENCRYAISNSLVFMDFFVYRSSDGERQTRMRETTPTGIPNTNDVFNSIEKYYFDRCTAFKYLPD